MKNRADKGEARKNARTKIDSVRYATRFRNALSPRSRLKIIPDSGPPVDTGGYTLTPRSRLKNWAVKGEARKNARTEIDCVRYAIRFRNALSPRSRLEIIRDSDPPVDTGGYTLPPHSRLKNCAVNPRAQEGRSPEKRASNGN
ncbi:MAG: hypothetical protein R3C53_26510 [Pirellulaceae bacterium]